MNTQTVDLCCKAELVDSFLPAQKEIQNMLYSLGITSKYAGFHYLSYAIQLVLRQPERINLVTKWLYPDVAKHFRTNWKTVERGMRFAVDVAWTTRKDELQLIAQGRLEYRPSASQFIGIIAKHLVTNSY